MKYNELISHLMPLVRGASDLPHLIWRNNGEWNLTPVVPLKEQAAANLETVKAHDPFVIEFIGKGLFVPDEEPSFVQDMVLAMRIRAEYNATPSSEANIGELYATTRFFEDNFAMFSSDVTEYLVHCEKPLAELDGMIPMSLRDDADDFGYDDSKLHEAIELVERKVAQLKKQTIGENSVVNDVRSTGDFKSVIEEITPLIEDADKSTPFIISRQSGEWIVNYPYPAESAGEFFVNIRKKDPLAISLTGADFDFDSEAYIYDKVLTSRVHAEYCDIRSSGKNMDIIHALVCFFNDNLRNLSNEAADYFASLDRPLAALVNMCPFDLTTEYENWTYNENLAQDAIHGIEISVISHLHHIDTDKPSPEQNALDGFAEKDSVQIASLKIVIAENPNAESPYLVYNCAYDNPFGVEEQYHHSAFPGYLSAMREFVTRQYILLDALEAERRESGLPFQTLTDADCLPNSQEDDWTGKVIIVKPELFASEYRSAEYQYALCIGGFGSKPDAGNKKVYVKDLHSGNECQYRRYDIAGLADPAKMPVWAIAKMKAHEIAQSPNEILADGTFMYGGHIFTPYRKYEKRDGDFHAQLRRVKTDRDIGLSTYDWQKHEYSYAAFYTASGNCEADIFKCWENGKLYVPGENELFCYNEPPQKTIRRTQPKPEKSSLLGKLDDNKQKVERDKAAVKVQPATHKRRPTEVTD